MPESVEVMALVCPRCGVEVEERFYGPCGGCREELGLTVANVARDSEAGRFVPKMNVVPNQIASRD